jgi:hypothetical protein
MKDRSLRKAGRKTMQQTPAPRIPKSTHETSHAGNSKIKYNPESFGALIG